MYFEYIFAFFMYIREISSFISAEAQGQLAAAVEKERVASEKVIDINARLTSLESQVNSLRQEKSRLSAELEMERAKAEVLEETKLT